MPAPGTPAVSVVMPCLNEAETVGRCVAEARAALERAGLDGEVVVADNGSTDGSQELARAAGARVVSVATRGYGAALAGGFAAARGEYVVMGDADLSYDFGAVPDFVAALDAGADLVMGSRFAGRIEKGAMPPLHRWLGNPALSGLGRLFFRAGVSDFHCGLRAFRRASLETLDLRTTGMEYASEMVVKAALFGLAIAEFPVTLRRDGRSRPPHLNTWRDGWRHLRFLLLYSPRWLFLVPGLALVLFGAALIFWLLPGPRAAFGATWDVHSILGGAAMVLVGAQAVFFGVCAKIFGITEGLLPRDPFLEPLFDRWVTLETGLAASAAALVLGAVLVAHVLLAWSAAGFRDLAYATTMRWMIPGVLLLVLGAEGVFGSFLLSLLGVRRR
ncbi:MAG TPA: glycosyltransferase family 2 protein [Thermoanaerobaculia bacterium]|nr:glycosyltransferase family 2 protein [Thermoanaerobaculia bacterium]